MERQYVITGNKVYDELDIVLRDNQSKKILLVCGQYIKLMQINKYLEQLEHRLGIKVVKFSSFKPNPLYESVVVGVDLFHTEKCDTIMAVGGGSAIDVAKCIKLFSNMSSSNNFLKQKIVPNDIKLIVIPTTAGTGSEATQYAVIYCNGEKQSISHYSCIPSVVLMEPSVLNTLSVYQKKVTMLDALCHAIESYWSINSTNESQGYSKQAIELILNNKDAYISNDMSANRNMLLAANIAGKAINIAQTTAGHAMCYKLTNLYGISHGHGAALCVSKLWPYMIRNTSKTLDIRGESYLKSIFNKLGDIFGCADAMSAADRFQLLLEELELEVPLVVSENDFKIILKSVNPIRLKNNPVLLDIVALDYLYHQILGGSSLK